MFYHVIVDFIKSFLIRPCLYVTYILDAWQTHARTYSRTILCSCCNIWRVRSAAFGRPTKSAQVKSCNLQFDSRFFPVFLKRNFVTIWWYWRRRLLRQTDIQITARWYLLRRFVSWVGIYPDLCLSRSMNVFCLRVKIGLVLNVLCSCDCVLLVICWLCVLEGVSWVFFELGIHWDFYCNLFLPHVTTTTYRQSGGRDMMLSAGRMCRYCLKKETSIKLPRLRVIIEITNLVFRNHALRMWYCVILHIKWNIECNKKTTQKVYNNILLICTELGFQLSSSMNRSRNSPMIHPCF